MKITFTWSVKDMHKITETGAVYKVEWSCSGVDADTEVRHSRSGSYLHMGEVTVDVAEVTKAYDEVTGFDDDNNPVVESVTRIVTKAHTEIKNVKPDHTASGFIAYASLTEADVLAWCKADGVEAETEALIARKIATKISESTKSTGMPWAAE